FFFSSRRRHTRFSRDWSSDVCSSDLFCNQRLAHRRSLAAHGVGCEFAAMRRALAATHGAARPGPRGQSVLAFHSAGSAAAAARRSEEHTSELQSRENLVCRLLLEKKQ